MEVEPSLDAMARGDARSGIKLSLLTHFNAFISAVLKLVVVRLATPSGVGAVKTISSVLSVAAQ